MPRSKKRRNQSKSQRSNAGVQFRSCTKCGEKGHKASSCPLLAQQLLDLAKRRHNVRSIKAFLDEGNQSLLVPGIAGVHGTGKKRKRGGYNLRSQQGAKNTLYKKKLSKKMKENRYKRTYKNKIRKQKALVTPDKGMLAKFDATDYKAEKAAFVRQCKTGWSYIPKECLRCKKPGLTMCCSKGYAERGKPALAFHCFRSKRWFFAFKFVFLRGKCRNVCVCRRSQPSLNVTIRSTRVCLERCHLYK